MTSRFWHSWIHLPGAEITCHTISISLVLGSNHLRQALHQPSHLSAWASCVTFSFCVFICACGLSFPNPIQSFTIPCKHSTMETLSVLYFFVCLCAVYMWVPLYNHAIGCGGQRTASRSSFCHHVDPGDWIWVVGFMAKTTHRLSSASITKQVLYSLRHFPILPPSQKTKNITARF